MSTCACAREDIRCSEPDQTASQSNSAARHAPPRRPWRPGGRWAPGEPRSAQWRCSRRCLPPESQASAPAKEAQQAARLRSRCSATRAGQPRRGVGQPAPPGGVPRPSSLASHLAQRVQLQEGGRLVGHAHLERRLRDLHAVVLGRDERLRCILARRVGVELELRMELRSQRRGAVRAAG